MQKKMKMEIIILNLLFNLVLIFLGLKKSFEPALYDRYFLNLALSLTVIVFFSAIYLHFIEKTKKVLLKGLLIGLLVGIIIGIILPWSLLLSYYPDKEFIGMYFILFALIAIVFEIILWPLIGLIAKRTKEKQGTSLTE